MDKLRQRPTFGPTPADFRPSLANFGAAPAEFLSGPGQMEPALPVFAASPAIYFTAPPWVVAGPAAREAAPGAGVSGLTVKLIALSGILLGLYVPSADFARRPVVQAKTGPALKTENARRQRPEKGGCVHRRTGQEDARPCHAGYAGHAGGTLL